MGEVEETRGKKWRQNRETRKKSKGANKRKNKESKKREDKCERKE